VPTNRIQFLEIFSHESNQSEIISWPPLTCQRTTEKKNRRKAPRYTRGRPFWSSPIKVDILNRSCVPIWQQTLPRECVSPHRPNLAKDLPIASKNKKGLEQWTKRRN
jgi:hypothetical protein